MSASPNKRQILLTDTRNYDVLIYDAAFPVQVEVDGPAVLTFKEPVRTIPSGEGTEAHHKRRSAPATTYIVETDGPATVLIDATSTTIKKVTITRRSLDGASRIGTENATNTTTAHGATDTAAANGGNNAPTDGLTLEGHSRYGSSEIVYISQDEGWKGAMEAPVVGAIYELRLARAPTDPPVTGVILFAAEERTMAGWLRESAEKDMVVGILRDNHDVQARVTDVSEGWYWKSGVNRWGTVNWKLVCDELKDCTCPAGVGRRRTNGGTHKKRNACEISYGVPMSDAGAESDTGEETE